MALVARCQDCSRHIEARLNRSSFVEVQDRRLAGRRAKPPPKYRSQTYKPLPKKRGYIRVLNLRGSSAENPLVECELVVHEFRKDLDLKQPYEALSWCWGTAKATAYVNIRKDGRVYGKYVQPDLFAALKALRHPKEDRHLWIDAICIDQDNPQEKNHQVEMMSEIYGRAEQVCIWLGEGDKSSQVALRFIRKEVLQLQNFDELCESELASEKWSALLDLMQRPWFSRRWVVQEIALARKAMVYCGNDKISWKKFAVAVELFVEVETATHRLSEVMKKDPKFYHVPGWFEYVSALGASLLVEATGKLFRDYKPNGPPEAETESDNESDTEPESEDDSSTTSEADSDTESDSDTEAPADNVVVANQGRALLSLEYLVSSLSIFDVTEPHDAVYALLAIAKDTIPSAGDEKPGQVLDYAQGALEDFTQKKRYKVDYTQPFSDVCKEFVQFCIHHSDQTRALDIICRPWAPEVAKSTPRRASPNTKKVTSGAVSGQSEKGRQSPENRSQNGKSGSKDGRGQELPEGKSSHRKKAKDQIPLPSWIPQLTGAAYAMLPQAGVHTLKMGRKNADTLVGLPSSQSLQRNYNAADTRKIDLKTFQFKRRAKLKHHSMFVKGFILDTIFELQPSSQGGAIPSGWARAGGWRNVPLSDPPDDFWRTLVADRGRDGRNPPVYYSRACKESFVKGGLSSGSVNTTDLINNERCSVVAQFCRRVQAVIWNRCLIKTQTGRLGLAGQYAQLEDVVCILYGCSVPVVLRRKWKTREQVEQEVDEDVLLWHEKVKATWLQICRNRQGRRLKRVLLQLKWMLWDEKMQKQWQGDEEWRAKWDQTVLDRRAAQEKVDKHDLTQRIVIEKEEMGCFLNVPGESEEASQQRLQRKGYKFWKAEKRAAVVATKGKWDEPMPNWREFKLSLRYGRRWKAKLLRRKKIENTRQQLLSLGEEQPAPPASIPNKGHSVRSSLRRATTAPENPIEQFHEVVHDKIEEKIDKTGKLPAPTQAAKARTDIPDATGKKTDEDYSPADLYINILTKMFMKKYMAEPEREPQGSETRLREPEHNINPGDSDETQLLQQNWCYYEVLGECYVHGMMDGEAMAYQNDNDIQAQVFELR